MFKRFLLMTGILALAVSCAQKGPKTLVLYYSQTSNTKAVAEEIASRLGADLEEVVVVNPYEDDFKATIDRCLKEREEGILPEVQPVRADLSKYDVIFLGYPIWFGTYAPPMAAVLEGLDLAGKKVVPFCTFGSGGLDSSVSDLAAKQPDAVILPGYGVRAARIDAAPAEIDRFLKAGGFIEGESTAPEPFPETHPVSEDEAALFDAAVDGYPMLHAEAVEVASRTVPEGTEYLFTAKDLPREDMPADFAPEANPKPIKVYVLAEEGKAPVFTQIVR